MSYRTLNLSNDLIELEVAPGFGARVTALIDRRSGRDWLVPGALVGGRDDAATYGGAQARGWDECFPTVAPCASLGWKARLRDHGSLWGRAWTCRRNATSIVAEIRSAGFRFERVLELQGASVTARYELENTGVAAFPFLWSQHCLLATRPGERIVLDGIGELRSKTGVLGWPADRDGRDQATIMDASARFYHKAYAPLDGQANVGIDADDGGIRWSWAAADAGYLGLWRDYGGWPADNPVHQVALEPTTAPADDLASAEALGKDIWLPPGDTRNWTVDIHLIH